MLAHCVRNPISSPRDAQPSRSSSVDRDAALAAIAQVAARLHALDASWAVLPAAGRLDTQQHRTTRSGGGHLPEREPAVARFSVAAGGGGTLSGDPVESRQREASDCPARTGRLLHRSRLPVPRAPSPRASALALQWRLRQAVVRATAPIFLLQAANDYSLGPAFELSREAERHHADFHAKVYPPQGTNRRAGHGEFCTAATDVWGNDVLAFLEAHMSTAR